MCVCSRRCLVRSAFPGAALRQRFASDAICMHQVEPSSHHARCYQHTDEHENERAGAIKDAPKEYLSEGNATGTHGERTRSVANGQHWPRAKQTLPDTAPLPFNPLLMCTAHARPGPLRTRHALRSASHTMKRTDAASVARRRCAASPPRALPPASRTAHYGQSRDVSKPRFVNLSRLLARIARDKHKPLCKKAIALKQRPCEKRWQNRPHPLNPAAS